MRMYVSVYLYCMYVCVVCIRVCNVCMYACMCTCLYVHDVYKYVCICNILAQPMYVHVCMYMYANTYAYVCTILAQVRMYVQVLTLIYLQVSRLQRKYDQALLRKYIYSLAEGFDVCENESVCVSCKRI
jgi:hypothetical protein